MTLRSLLAGLALLAACGIKAPPRPPLPEKPSVGATPGAGPAATPPPVPCPSCEAPAGSAPDR